MKCILVAFFENLLSIYEHHLWVTLKKHKNYGADVTLKYKKDRLHFFNFRRLKNKRQNLKDDSASI